MLSRFGCPPLWFVLWWSDRPLDYLVLVRLMHYYSRTTAQSRCGIHRVGDQQAATPYALELYIRRHVRLHRLHPQELHHTWNSCTTAQSHSGVHRVLDQQAAMLRSLVYIDEYFDSVTFIPMGSILMCMNGGLCRGENPMECLGDYVFGQCLEQISMS